MKALKIVPICALAFLSACGGGGDSGSTTTSSGNSGSSGGTSTTSTTTAGSIQITSSNAADASAYSYSTMEAVNSQSAISSGFVTGVSIDALPKSVLQSALSQLYTGVATQSASQLATGVSETQSVACPGGGSATVSINAASASQVQSGDRLSVSASNCSENGTLINGSVDFLFNSVTGTVSSSGAWSASMTMNYSAFSVTSGGMSVQANGNMTVNYAQTGDTAWAAQMSGTSFNVDLTKSDSSVIKRTLSNYSLKSSAQGGVTAFEGNYTLTGTSPKLGTVSFGVKTNTPFKTLDGSANPYTGSVTVTGANGSNATLTAIDNANVRIDIDKNGDGVTDDTVNTTWSVFRSHL